MGGKTLILDGKVTKVEQVEVDSKEFLSQLYDEWKVSMKVPVTAYISKTKAGQDIWVTSEDHFRSTHYYGTDIVEYHSPSLREIKIANSFEVLLKCFK